MRSTVQPPKAPSPQKSRRRLRRRILVGALALLLAIVLAVGWALNRYVVEHVAISDVAAYEAAHSVTTDTDESAPASSDAATAPDASAEAVTTATTYTSDQADIAISTVTTGSGNSTVTYYVADVTLTDATALRSAFAENAFGENIVEDTSDIAAANDAVFAINGDYYGFRDTGIVIRNGVIYRDEGAREGLVFYRDGTVEVYDETTTSAAELLAAGAWNTLSFGPALLDGGQVIEGIDEVEIDTNFGNHSIQGKQPRTAVGLIDANHLVFVVVDGRSPGYSAGVSMTGLAEIMQGLGAATAYNLDGGGSSTMYFDGALVNDPLGKGKERGTSDILYIGG